MNILFHRYKQIKGLIFFTYLKIVRKIRILINLPIYYVIGDSHTTNFLNPAFIIHHIGPATAYRLNFSKSSTHGREKVLKILKNIYKQKPLNVIFVFGELDVRIHINKTAQEKKISIANVVSSTVDSYFNFLKYIKTNFPMINIYVFNVLPQGEEGNIYNFPYYADREKRAAIAVEVNKKLEIYSKKANYKFIDIYNMLIDSKGRRKKEYVFDDVHFNRKIIKFVLEEIK